MLHSSHMTARWDQFIAPSQQTHKYTVLFVGPELSSMSPDSSSTASVIVTKGLLDLIPRGFNLLGFTQLILWAGEHKLVTGRWVTTSVIAADIVASSSIPGLTYTF